MCIDSLVAGLKVFSSDAFFFKFLQIFLWIFGFICLLNDYKPNCMKNGIEATVTRGEKSWSHLNLMYGILSISILEVNNNTTALNGYISIINVADLSLLFYLCFFNSYFRNKIIGVISSSQQKEEK